MQTPTVTEISWDAYMEARKASHLKQRAPRPRVPASSRRRRRRAPEAAVKVAAARDSSRTVGSSAETRTDRRRGPAVLRHDAIGSPQLKTVESLAFGNAAHRTERPPAEAGSEENVVIQGFTRAAKCWGATA